jgi:hypothetical protein
MKALAKQLLRPISRYAPPFVQQWRHKRHADLQMDAASFEGFSPAIRPYMAKVAATRFYRYAEERAIPGFISAKERQILYALARWLPGPITEIGAWLGRSTTAMARGVRDSGQPKEFRTYDLKLSEDQFRPVVGGIGWFVDDEDVPRGICSEEIYQQDMLPVLRAPGGANGMLKRNLAMLGLLEMSQIFVGDFRSFPPVTSGVLFCDTLHDEHEIRVNAPALRPWLTKGSILACHDVGNSKPLIDLLRTQIPLGHGVSVDLLYITEVL